MTSIFQRGATAATRSNRPSTKGGNAKSGAALISALRKCDTLASKSAKLCHKETNDDAATESSFRFAASESLLLRDLEDDTSSPTAFHMIQRVLDEEGSFEAAVAKCNRMKASAEEIAQQSAKTMASISKAIALAEPTDTTTTSVLAEQEHEAAVEDRDGADETVPDSERAETTKRALFSESGDTDDYDSDEDAVVEPYDPQVDTSFLAQVDTDISELEGATERTNSELDLFNASSLGADVMDLASGKGQASLDLFTKMYGLCDNLQEVSRSVLQGAGGSCVGRCSQMRDLAGGMAGLLQAQQLVHVLLQTADAAVRLVTAMTTLISGGWGKIQGFLEQFMAAKTLSRFAGTVKARNAANVDDMSLNSEGFSALLERFTCNPCPGS